MTEADKAHEGREEKIATQIARKIAAIPENRPEHAADHKLRAIEEIIENTIKMVERHTGKELRDQLSKEREKVKLFEEKERAFAGIEPGLLDKPISFEVINLKKQLQKERETVEMLKRAMVKGTEMHAHLKFDDEPFTPYQLALQQLEKERKMRKELVEEVQEIILWCEDMDYRPDPYYKLKSLIAKATELDKK